MAAMIKTANPAPGNTIYARQRQHLALAFKAPGRRLPVRLLTTGASARNIDGLPEAVVLYNKYMGGVDEADGLMSFYCSDRRSMKVNHLLTAFT